MAGTWVTQPSSVSERKSWRENESERACTRQVAGAVQCSVRAEESAGARNRVILAEIFRRKRPKIDKKIQKAGNKHEHTLLRLDS